MTMLCTLCHQAITGPTWHLRECECPLCAECFISCEPHDCAAEPAETDERGQMALALETN